MFHKMVNQNGCINRSRGLGSYPASLVLHTDKWQTLSSEVDNSDNSDAGTWRLQDTAHLWLKSIDRHGDAVR